MKRINSLVNCWPVFVSVFAFLSCGETNDDYAKAYKMESMAQSIGGPAAAGRPGDYVLENDKIRAIIHGRHNKRSTFPIGNGNLIDMDLQRPHHQFGVGKGKDTFYELAPMVNLKVSTASQMQEGLCSMVGQAPCPSRSCKDIGCSGATGEDHRCARISVEGTGDNILGILGLLDLAITKTYPSNDLRIVTDYDLCPGETFVRVTSQAIFYSGLNETIDMPELKERTSLLDVLLGQHSGIDCAREACPPEAPNCEDLLISLSLGDFSTEMKRCRSDTDSLAGVLTGDYTFFAAKSRVFIPGSGFDNETTIRATFDTGGDVFSNPLSSDWVTAVGDDVSYAYFNQGGKMMIPLFSESFTAAMSNQYACPQNNSDCFKDRALVFRRYVSVGDGSVASTLEPFYQMRNIPTAKLKGHVIDERTRLPISHANVFLIKLPASWELLSDAEIAKRSYAELAETARNETKTEYSPLGEVGIVSHFRTDTGLDTVPDGSFSGKIPIYEGTSGRYVLMTQDSHRLASKLVPIKASAGQEIGATVVRSLSGVLAYQIRDSSGRAIPSKVTIGACMPECAKDADCIERSGFPMCNTTLGICVDQSGGLDPKSCRPDQHFDNVKGSCVCPTSARLPLELGGKRYSDGTIQTALDKDGQGEVALPPGTYEVIASRGLEYEIERRFVTIKADVTTRFEAALPRVVDTKGWISADFHVHGPNSVDASIGYDDRVVSYVAEGVEFLSSSDHDYLTDYRPTIFKLGVQPWINTQVGAEISPLDYGHFLGFPLRFDENLELNGSFHWRIDDPGGTPDWVNLTPAALFKKIREYGFEDQTMVVIAHFYDHFAFFDLDPITLEQPAFSVTSLFNPVLRLGNFSGKFDGVEALSGKNVDVLRRATYSEIQDYNIRLSELIARKDLTYSEIQAEWGRLSANAQRNFLRRTKEEQAAGLVKPAEGFQCRCMQDSECGELSLCDERRATCVAGCRSSDQCNQTLVTIGKEDCLPMLATTSVTRKTCQRVQTSCTDDASCGTYEWAQGIKEVCLDAFGTGKQCELSCAGDGDCVDPLRPLCDRDKGVCIEKTIVAAAGVAPCVTVRGTIDDWFQMLNRGVHRTVLGDSDSHDAYGIEGGIPRNYVRSSTDQPQAIEKREVAQSLRNMKSFATFGPFVEVSINGKPMGSTVKLGSDKSVSLSIRVQSPKWFDVDRLEIYRNGELVQIIEGKENCTLGALDCIKVPNNEIVNYNATIFDKPTEDSWYVVIALGLDGKSLAPVYSSTPVARLGMFELVQRLTPLLPPLRSLRTPLAPSISVVRPYAVTNPIFVDVDGDGIIKAKESLPTWATDADRQAQAASQSSSLTTKKHQMPLVTPSKGLAHDHRRGTAKMRRELEDVFKNLKGEDRKTAIKQILSSLRYISIK